MSKKTADLISKWLESRLSAEQTEWFGSQLKKISQSNSDRELHITLGLVPRKLGREDLTLTASELAEAEDCLQGWNPSGWSIDIAARVAVMCHIATLREEQFGETITDLCRNADLAESIALYSGVSHYPQSSLLDQQIGEGLRTNMRSVFEAIAHQNPYPAAHFDENRWNHMVLKALFIDSTLAPIYGLDERANAELARILCDYANERWAAGRDVTHELWRCVGPFATGDMIDDLERASKSDNNTEKSAALLALSASSDPRAAKILGDQPSVADRIGNGSLTWDALHKQDQQEQTGNAP